MIRADFHTHTTFCDGKSTPREMVESAYRKGFIDFGISGHADFTMYEAGFGMTDEKMEQYKKELYALREEYAGRMNLYIGIELDILGPLQKAEYAIGSVHCVEKNGEVLCVDDTEEKLVDGVNRLWQGDWYGMAKDYFEMVSRVYDVTHCDWVGHFDLLTKFNENPDGSFRYFDATRDAFLEPALAAMKRLNGQGLPFEINTGAISRGYRSVPYPSKFLLKELKSMGGRIILSSDSHSVENIGYGFDSAVKLARECGFTHSCVLKPGGGFREVDLKEAESAVPLKRL